MAAYVGNLGYYSPFYFVLISLCLSSWKEGTSLDTDVDICCSALDGGAVADSQPTAAENACAFRFFGSLELVCYWYVYPVLSLPTFKSDSKTANQVGSLWYRRHVNRHPWTTVVIQLANTIRFPNCTI